MAEGKTLSKPQSRKSKGRKLQQHARDRILEVFGLEEGDAESRSMGAGGIDIMLSPKARTVCPLSIECKNTRVIPTKKAIEQARFNAYKDTLPIILWKPHGGEYMDSMVMVPFEDLLKFIKERLKNE